MSFGYPRDCDDLDVVGFDLTLSPSKSVSLIWALGSDDDARQVEEALHVVRDEVERYLESTACFVRLVDMRAQSSSRAKDSSGRSSCIARAASVTLASISTGPSSTSPKAPTALRHRSTARRSTGERYAAEAVFQATLCWQLVVRLGLVFDDMVFRHGVAEAAGVSAPTCDAASCRCTEIVAEMNRLGVHSGEGARTPRTLNTRKPKLTGITEDELRASGDGVPATTASISPTSLELSGRQRSGSTTASYRRWWSRSTPPSECRDSVRAAARAARQGASRTRSLTEQRPTGSPPRRSRWRAVDGRRKRSSPPNAASLPLLSAISAMPYRANDQAVAEAV